MVIIGALVCANVFFTMFTHTHLWSGQDTQDSRIANSIVTTSVTAKRGTIYDRNNSVIAEEVTAYTIVAYLDESYVDSDGNADYVKNIKSTAKSITSVLKDVDKDNLIDIMTHAQSAGQSQTELGTGTKRISEEEKEKLEKLDLQGIHFVETVDRNYPTTPYASNLVGYATYDEDSQSIKGILGLESTLNDELAGTDGLITYQQTVNGDVLSGTTQVIQEAVDGNDVVLTIDSAVQTSVEAALEETMEDNDAESAWCIVMEVETGKILGYASYPTFDQNEHDEIPNFMDTISETPYEPGSVMKPFTFATAIDTGVYPEGETYRAGSFLYTYDEDTKEITRIYSGTTSYPAISDALGNDFGTITFDQALAYSSNVGICELLANYINYKDFGKYLDKFGFFQETGIPYVSEAQVGTKNVDMPMGYLNTGFGQSSSITILQLCQAYTAIFNDGEMLRPYVVDSIVNSETGETIKKYKKKVVGNPISEETADQVSELMSHVLDDGASGEKFQMDGVDLIAKTGTGEIYNVEQGQYDEDVFTSSIMAAAPGSDPKVMVYWRMVSDNYINYSAEPFQSVMKAALVAEGITGSDTNFSDEEQSDDTERWSQYEMPSLINHTTTYAKQQLSDKNVEVYYIGDGDTIINQYPTSGSVLNSNDRVFLLTNGTSVTMPNMTNWTRKDIQAFSELTGISITISGTGKVTSQSIEEGQTIDASSSMDVQLE